MAGEDIPQPADTPGSMYESYWRVNFLTAATVLSAVMPAVVAARGSIVLTSSVNAVSGIGEWPVRAPGGFGETRGRHGPACPSRRGLVRALETAT